MSNWIGALSEIRTRNPFGDGFLDRFVNRSDTRAILNSYTY